MTSSPIDKTGLAIKPFLSKRFIRKMICAVILMATVVYASTPSISDDFTDRRLTAGAKIFRALLAADIDIDKKTAAAGELRLCLLYLNDPKNAEIAAVSLENRGDSQIRKKDVRIDILPYSACIEPTKGRYAGIFLTQPLGDHQLSELVDYTKKQKMLVFSPFEGDVERGVQSGIAVEARVRPYLNTTAVQSAGIRLKSFFLRVSKQYDE